METTRFLPTTESKDGVERRVLKCVGCSFSRVVEDGNYKKVSKVLIHHSLEFDHKVLGRHPLRGPRLNASANDAGRSRAVGEPISKASAIGAGGSRAACEGNEQVDVENIRKGAECIIACEQLARRAAEREASRLTEVLKDLQAELNAERASRKTWFDAANLGGSAMSELKEKFRFLEEEFSSLQLEHASIAKEVDRTKQEVSKESLKREAAEKEVEMYIGQLAKMSLVSQKATETVAELRVDVEKERQARVKAEELVSERNSKLVVLEADFAKLQSQSEEDTAALRAEVEKERSARCMAEQLAVELETRHKSDLDGLERLKQEQWRQMHVIDKLEEEKMKLEEELDTVILPGKPEVFSNSAAGMKAQADAAQKAEADAERARQARAAKEAEKKRAKLAAEAERAKKAEAAEKVREAKRKAEEEQAGKKRRESDKRGEKRPAEGGGGSRKKIRHNNWVKFMHNEIIQKWGKSVPSNLTQQDYVSIRRELSLAYHTDKTFDESTNKMMQEINDLFSAIQGDKLQYMNLSANVKACLKDCPVGKHSTFCVLGDLIAGALCPPNN